ncbi:MAG: oxidoreductase [Ruminococcaceae bacterium]|nr:oxidoreductase [Oscillospiraceae bacterium]
MIYKQFADLKLSALGLGTMRFPTVGEDPAAVDMEKTREIVDHAFRNGVNYFDTAWFYHAGKSESVMGEILSAYPRESFYLATKFPGLDPKNLEKKEDIFEEQLKRCRVDHFDFYLFHNVSDKTIDDYLNPAYGLLDYLLEQKKKGRIKHLGFSTHASNGQFVRFLDAYGAHMEFCQIQLNYLDWNYQAAGEKVRILNERNIPIWVMEPVRGGKLAALSPEHLVKMKAIRAEESPAAMAFRFIQSQKGICVTLSGMSNLAQVKENIATFSEEKPFTEKELQAIFEIADDMVAQNALPCTACRYCEEKCPKKLPISQIFAEYNATRRVTGENVPTACISCKQCEKVCPQEIKIASVMTYLKERKNA